MEFDSLGPIRLVHIDNLAEWDLLVFHPDRHRVAQCLGRAVGLRADDRSTVAMRWRIEVWRMTPRRRALHDDKRAYQKPEDQKPEDQKPEDQKPEDQKHFDFHCDS